MKREIEDIIKDIDGVDSMNKVKELMDVLKSRKDELMCNDASRLALIYGKLLNTRKGEFNVIRQIADILRKYINGTDIKNITDDDWFDLKEILFPKEHDGFKPVLSNEEFDRLYPEAGRQITKETIESDPFYQMLKISLEDKNDTASIPTSSH